MLSDHVHSDVGWGKGALWGEGGWGGTDLVVLGVICQLSDHMLGHSLQQGLGGPKQGLPWG